MSEWKEYKFDQIARLIYGKSLPERERKDGIYPVYGSGGIVGYHEKPFVKSTGIIIGRKGSIGTVYYTKEPFYPIDTVYYIKELEGKNDLVFFYYFIKQLNLEKYNSDAAVPGLNRNLVHKLYFKYPPLPEQQQIASILSTYDELIENNNRRIAILEQTAEQIYKEWFVRMRFPGYENTEFEKGVPKDWKVKKLKQIVSTQYGYTASADMEIEGPKFLRITDIANSYIDWSNVPNCPINENEIEKYKLKFGDIVVARTGATAGYAKRIHKNHPTSVFASYLVRIKLKDVRLNYYIGLIVESNTYKEFIMSIAGGAAQPQANANVLTEMSVFVPDIGIIEKFNSIVEPVFDQIENLRNQNQNLKQTRDLLLPRLISGKLRVKEILTPSFRAGNMNASNNKGFSPDKV